MVKIFNEEGHSVLFINGEEEIWISIEFNTAIKNNIISSDFNEVVGWEITNEFLNLIAFINDVSKIKAFLEKKQEDKKMRMKFSPNIKWKLYTYN